MAVYPSRKTKLGGTANFARANRQQGSTIKKITKKPKATVWGNPKATFGAPKAKPRGNPGSTWSPLSSGGTLAPAPQAATAAQAQPFDALYESQLAGANRQYGQTAAGLDYQEAQTKRQFGFDDPSDPFNAMAMLQRNYQQGRSRLINTGDNPYSSAYQRNLDEAQYGFTRSEGDLRSKYQEALNAIQQQRAQAQIDKDSAYTSAQADALGRAPRAEGPGETYASPAGKAPASKTPAKKPKPQPKKKVKVADFGKKTVKPNAPAAWGQIKPAKKKGRK